MIQYKTNVDEFRELLKGPSRILALCGAGLSASSGLPTFRGAGGIWREFEATSLATPEAFEDDPAMVWLFYAWRRHMALKAKPNAAHYALAELAKKKNDDFLCLTQNVDGLSPRAGHPAEGIKMLHGSLLDLKCADECGYIERDNLQDPLCPALAAAAEDAPPGKLTRLLDPNVPTPVINTSELPQCPDCRRRGKAALLRPGVVWFGEALPELAFMEADNWVRRQKVDIMLVIGTSAAVYPAAGFTSKARKQGAVVAVINPDPTTCSGLGKDDFFFQGDAAEFLPKMFADIIGDLTIPGEPAAAAQE